MAIKSKYFSTQFHVEFENSYQKIDNIRINNNNVSFDVYVYATQQSRDINAQPVSNMPYGLPLDTLDLFQGDNIVAKLYDFCKKEHPMYKVEGIVLEDV